MYLLSVNKYITERIYVFKSLKKHYELTLFYFFYSSDLCIVGNGPNWDLYGMLFVMMIYMDLMTMKEQHCTIIFADSQILHRLKESISKGAENSPAASSSTSSAHSPVAPVATKRTKSSNNNK